MTSESEIPQKDLRKISSTKIKILKSLKERRKTLSEISRELKLSKSTVHTHLNDLCEAGFVRRLDDDHKWVYYELTEKAELLLKRHLRRIALIISSIASLLASIYMLAKHFMLIAQRQKYLYERVALGPSYEEFITLVLGFVFAVVGVLLLILYFRKRAEENV